MAKKAKGGVKREDTQAAKSMERLSHITEVVMGYVLRN